MPECIYCSKPPDSPEHWLPRSLGTFGPLQVLHDKICDDCNQALGREIDPEFARVGPEAILRAGLGVEGRRGPSKSPFYYKAATEQPLRAVVPEAPEDEAGLLWETVPGSSGDPEGRLLQQLVIVDGSEKRHVIPFNIEWSADVLRKAVQHRGIEGGKLTEIYLDPEHLDRAKPILSEVSRNSPQNTLVAQEQDSSVERSYLRTGLARRTYAPSRKSRSTGHSSFDRNWSATNGNLTFSVVSSVVAIFR